MLAAINESMVFVNSEHVAQLVRDTGMTLGCE